MWIAVIAFCLSSFLDKMSRCSSPYLICRDIFRNDCACCDYSIISNCYSFHNSGVHANLYMRAYVNWFRRGCINVWVIIAISYIDMSAYSRMVSNGEFFVSYDRTSREAAMIADLYFCSWPPSLEDARMVDSTEIKQ